MEQRGQTEDMQAEDLSERKALIQPSTIPSFKGQIRMGQ